MSEIKNEKPEIEESKIVEELITPQGYFKIPQAVKDKFGTPTNFPNPRWDAVLNEEQGTLKIVYTIKVHEIKKDKQE